MRSQKREEGSKQGKVRSDKKKREERREKREERREKSEAFRGLKRGLFCGGRAVSTPSRRGRTTAYLRGRKDRGDAIHCENAVDLFCGERGVEGAKTQPERRERREERREKMGADANRCIFIVPRGHLGEVLKIIGGGAEMATEQIHSIFTVPRGHLDEGRKNSNELAKACFAKVVKSRGCHEDDRELESLHIYSVPWPLRREQKRAPKKASNLRCCFEKAVV